jgi:hypothetical protein
VDAHGAPDHDRVVEAKIVDDLAHKVGVLPDAQRFTGVLRSPEPGWIKGEYGAEFVRRRRLRCAIPASTPRCVTAASRLGPLRQLVRAGAQRPRCLTHCCLVGSGEVVEGVNILPQSEPRIHVEFDVPGVEMGDA